jgi:hypothetical protein
MGRGGAQHRLRKSENARENGTRTKKCADKLRARICSQLITEVFGPRDKGADGWTCTNIYGVEISINCRPARSGQVGADANALARGRCPALDDICSALQTSVSATERIRTSANELRRIVSRPWNGGVLRSI